MTLLAEDTIGAAGRSAVAIICGDTNNMVHPHLVRNCNSPVPALDYYSIITSHFHSMHALPKSTEATITSISVIIVNGDVNKFERENACAKSAS